MQRTGGADAKCHQHRRPQDLRGGGDRGDRELHGNVTRAVALREAGGDRQPVAGQGDQHARVMTD